MNLRGYISTHWQHLVEEVQHSLPDGIEFDLRKHVLPLFLPFLLWKDDLKQPGTLKADFLAGLTGAVIVLPQGIAFALIAGLPPVYGLYTAIVAPVIAALFGSSRHLVSGPTTPISLVVFAAVSRKALEGSPEYIEKVLLLTFMVGLIQLSLGLGRMGRYISFISHTVIVGFTAGSAVLIITNQMKNVLGLEIPGQASFIDTWYQLLGSIHLVKLPNIAVALYTLIATLVFRKYIPRIPYLLGGLVMGSLLAWAIGDAAAGIRMVGEIPRALPSFSTPGFSASAFHDLLGDAFAVALLGLIGAVSISRSISLKSGQAIDVNQEFIGQGLSNLLGSFFSCYASSGSFTRSGVNYEAGARTPMAAIFAAAILLAIVLALGPLAAYLPFPALSGLILLIGWSLIDFRHIRDIGKASRQENLILGTTFFTTLFAELNFAIYIGVFLSLFFFLRRTSMPNVAIMAPDTDHRRHKFVNIIRKDLLECPQIKIIRIDGHLYFGAIDHISGILREIRKGEEKHLMILAEGINYVDLDGAEWLARESAYWKKRGGGLYIVRLKKITHDILESGGFFEQIGRNYFFDSKADAIADVYQKIDREKCRACQQRVFQECENDKELPSLGSEED
jgi:SulP family sulfate permease